MNNVLYNIIWPACAGLLAAVLIIDRWILEQPQPIAHGGPASYREVVAIATPSVVNIYTAKPVNQRRGLLNDPLLRRFLRNAPVRQRYERSLGSGVIMSAEGHIITNDHVIADAEVIQVLLHDGRIADAAVVGRDPETDLAILHTDLDDLTPIEIANSDQLRVGDVVLSIGNPYGFGHSVSQGIISGLSRYGLRLSVYEDYIQTDASVHFGSSGGALVDSTGRLIGINTLIITGNGETPEDSSGIGINLATPSNLATFVMDDLIRYGKVVRGWLGVSVDVNITLDSFGQQRPVMVVTELTNGGPAQVAGVRVGDVFDSVNGEEIRNGRTAIQRLASLRPGEVVRVGIRREEKAFVIEAVVGIRPGDENLQAN